MAGNQHWGHATSRDLYHWTNQAIAIYPRAEGEGIFSGSAVVDANNTSGFFPNQTNGVVAIYTLNTARAQQQEIAYSVDGGFTFTKYAGNPVIPSNSTQFRDPKVIWHAETQTWVMVVSYAQEFTIGIFTSSNLKRWTHASNFTHHGLLGLQFECPNMVEMPFRPSPYSLSASTSSIPTSMYLLAISINPGAPLGGSITQYFPGTFNGTHFTAVDSTARIADFGKDNYAGQWFYGIPSTEPQVSIGWASNWEYAEEVPTGQLEGWRSSMSLPRRNHLTNITRLGWDLVSEPYDLGPVLGDVLALNTSLGNGSVLVDYSSVSSGALYLDVNISSIPSDGSATGTLNITFLSSVSGESHRAGYFLGGDAPIYINRGGIAGFAENPFFTDRFSTPVLLDSAVNATRIEGVIDRSIFEFFLNGGEKSATTTFFPEQPLDTLVVAARGVNEGVGVSVKIVALESAWAKVENATGVVVGNATVAERRGWLDG